MYLYSIPTNQSVTNHFITQITTALPIRENNVFHKTIDPVIILNRNSYAYLGTQPHHNRWNNASHITIWHCLGRAAHMQRLVYRLSPYLSTARLNVARYIVSTDRAQPSRE